MSLDYSKIIGGQENQAAFNRKSYSATKKKIPGCNSDKKLIFFKKKLQPSL
jgi:hypothetical protein